MIEGKNGKVCFKCYCHCEHLIGTSLISIGQLADWVFVLSPSKEAPKKTTDVCDIKVYSIVQPSGKTYQRKGEYW